jgi:hypothetical protein
MRTHVKTRAGATTVGALLGATAWTAMVGGWAQPAAAATPRSPMLDPPVMVGDPPPMDPLMQQAPGAAVDDLVAQVQQFVAALVPPCVPSDGPLDQSDPSTTDAASTRGTTGTAQACNVVVARNVGSPGAVAIASQSQDAPVTQASSPTEDAPSD